MSPATFVGVVGSGLMGSGIAEVCARAGLSVLVAEANAPASEAGRLRIERSLTRGLRGGKLTVAEHDSTLDRISYTTDLDDFADRELVLEAVAEDEQVKTDIFGVLDKVVQSRDAIFASNTSSIPIMKIAMATQRPQRVIGIHFFNPVPVLRLVEIIPSLFTDDDTDTRAEAFVSGVLGKTVIRASDRAGFIVNALLIPYLLAAIRMLESGHASAADIDRGMVLGCAHPLGPLALADLIGLEHHQGRRGLDVRGVQGAPLRAPAAAAAHGGRRPAGQEDRPRLPRLHRMTRVRRPPPRQSR